MLDSPGKHLYKKEQINHKRYLLTKRTSGTEFGATVVQRRDLRSCMEILPMRLGGHINNHTKQLKAGSGSSANSNWQEDKRVGIEDKGSLALRISNQCRWCHQCR